MLEHLKKFAKQAGDTQEVTFRKLLILVIALLCSTCGLIWSALYFYVFDWGIIAALPLSFVVIVGSAIMVAHYMRNLPALCGLQHLYNGLLEA